MAKFASISDRCLERGQTAANGLSEELSRETSFFPLRSGGHVNEQPAELDLTATELGLDSLGNPSWTDRILEILDRIGPFKLSYLEMLLRSADQRASAKALGKQ